MPVSKIWANGQLNHPGTQPGNSVGHFRRRFRERSILGRVTNRNYDASQFKGRGSVLTIPDTPIVTTRKTSIGKPVEYDEVKTGAHFMVIDRERYWGVKIEDEDKIFASFDIESPIVQEADLQLAEDVEDELISDVMHKTHEANQGLEAGIKSGIYNLGTAANPVTLYKTEAARDGREGAIATDHFGDFANVIGEQPGGLGEGAFILCPRAVAGVLQKGVAWWDDADFSTLLLPSLDKSARSRIGRLRLEIPLSAGVRARLALIAFGMRLQRIFTRRGSRKRQSIDRRLERFSWLSSS